MTTMANRCVLPAAVLVAAASVASALEEVNEELARQRLESGVTFQFVQTPVADAVSFFQGLGANVVVQQEVLTKLGETPVTMKLTNVRLIHALRAFAASLELDCEMLEGPVVFLRQPPANDEKPVGKMSLKIGTLALELDLRRHDVPSDVRRDFFGRAVHLFHQEAEERERGLERHRREAEREGDDRRDRGGRERDGRREPGRRERGERERRERTDGDPVRDEDDHRRRREAF